ncbi:hypothetical protein KO507_09655 [Gilvimarinus agarilyticus]|uniref:hypothetical protein n=1 Tax=Gilvimarinus sp. 2_MG-2023 TaxID=3062666 RepID=UPI001C08D5F8|nr:hypothetical protein [Gilvimarinus sp. 2_MG-2023]MBU2886025.1 hypothetical protein [Gilvimarinus agarilyticus]MDO6570771.1 hypothetical protein [Gilvimarinus sp. 2_MG-2023]
MKIFYLALVTVLFFSHPCFSTEPLSPIDQRYVERLSIGGPTTIRDVAKSIYRSEQANTQVLDVAAEVLMRDYQVAIDNTQIDALAWVIKALALADTNRYQVILAEVAENASHRKIAKYARKMQDDDLPEGPAYEPGSVVLADYEPDQASPVAGASAATESNREVHPITIVREGMSIQEAYDLVGYPTSEHTYQTGKQWIPFNYKGGDIRRQAALYKGQGRIVFSNTSRYSNSWRVLEVLVDEAETGYP